MNPEFFLRPHIRDMDAYTPILPFDVLSDQLGIPERAIVKLDANENPYGPLPEVKAALAALDYPHIYPDPESRALRNATSEYTQVPANNLLAGAGADELIDLIMRLCINPGDAVINCPPTFGMYRFDTQINAGRVISVGRKADFSLDLAAIMKAVHQFKPKLLFLASPNNPDGSLAAPEVIAQLLALPVILILDEAYVEFASPGRSWLAQVPNHDNLVVLRTFSKWAGLAGLRVGYGAFPDWMMPHLWKIKQPYNVSVAAAAAAIVSLEHADQLKLRADAIIQERQHLTQALEAIPWLDPYPSQGNYVLCKVQQQAAARVKNRLAQQGILIRYFDKPGLKDHIRISVGTPTQTERLIAALETIQGD